VLPGAFGWLRYLVGLRFVSFHQHSVGGLQEEPRTGIHRWTNGVELVRMGIVASFPGSAEVGIRMVNPPKLVSHLVRRFAELGLQVKVGPLGDRETCLRGAGKSEICRGYR
jgi:hypothetical protein